MDKTYIPKANEIKQEWYLVDANGQNLGRLASEIATVLLGKHKPDFTPGMDTGDFVVVVNCERVQVTGNKLTEKFYYRYSLYPSGLTATSLKDQLKDIRIEFSQARFGECFLIISMVARSSRN